MPCLLTMPNELLGEIISYLQPLATFHLLLTCLTLCSRVKPAMLRHAVAPKCNMPTLHWAARHGQLPLVQYLLTVIPVELEQEDGLTALHEAASVFNREITEYLLLHGANVNHGKQAGWAPISGFVQGGIYDAEAAETTIRILLTHGADVRSTLVYVPLEDAICCGAVGVVRRLLEAGASPTWSRTGGIPPIMSVARNAETAAVEMLLGYGADIDVTDSSNGNATMEAAKGGYLETLRLLVDRGANLNFVDDYGNTALAYAFMYHENAVTEYLVGCEGLDISHNGHGNRAPVHLAVRFGSDVALRTLLLRGTSIRHEDPLGRSRLHTAVLGKEESVVRTLLENGAEIDIEGIALLVMGIEVESVAIVAVLLDYGIELTWRCQDRWRLLKLACLRGTKEIVELLLQRGVDVNMLDEQGMTLMAHAQQERLFHVVDILSTYRAV